MAVKVPTVCVDAMGGDHAPSRIVEAAVEALAAHPGRFEVVLVGDEGQIHAEFDRLGIARDHITVRHAAESVGMGEKATAAIRQKRDTSLAVATAMMREGEADALVSAGNTGAVVTSALQGLGRIPGIRRPAIAMVVPTRQGRCVVLDVGATTDCKPEWLGQFAILGSLYAELAFDVATPRVGLLNIGEEPGKGDCQARAAYEHLGTVPVNFIGNVEGRDVMSGTADVVVCDGFVGNVLLKFAESFVETLAHFFRAELESNLVAKVGAGLAKPAFKRTMQRFDYAEYGGAPLLGVRGGCIICHGSSPVRAVRNAIRVAAEFVEDDLNGRVVSLLEKGQAHG